jgi:hypothetical protein
MNICNKLNINSILVVSMIWLSFLELQCGIVSIPNFSHKTFKLNIYINNFFDHGKNNEKKFEKKSKYKNGLLFLKEGMKLGIQVFFLCKSDYTFLM